MTTLIVPAAAVEEVVRLLQRADATFTVHERPVTAAWRIQVERFGDAQSVADQVADRWTVDVAQEPEPGPTATDLERGAWLLEQLRVFAWYNRPDPLDPNYERGCWDGSGADHADQLYQLLDGIGLKP